MADIASPTPGNHQAKDSLSAGQRRESAVSVENLGVGTDVSSQVNRAARPNSIKLSDLALTPQRGSSGTTERGSSADTRDSQSGPTVTAEKAQAFDDLASYGHSLRRGLPITSKTIEGLSKAFVALSRSTSDDLDKIADAALKLPRGWESSKAELIADLQAGVFMTRAIAEGTDLAKRVGASTSEAERKALIEKTAAGFVDVVSEQPATLRSAARTHFVEGYKFGRGIDLKSDSPDANPVSLKLQLDNEVALIQRAMLKNVEFPFR